ncbi:thioredoxin [Paraferrimonas sedimenticola]|uniref:thioredoxin n=1 Tax=Paraferrimonas sedimenticola TaxID=375674 RepID=UPI001B80304E|nr:thioredoxin [Paraferrimonas sedimenticola]
MQQAVLNLSDTTFADEIKQGGVVLVDFWAEWCGPCKALTPIIEELAQEFAGRAKVAKVNVADGPEVAQQYGIRSIPYVLVFKDGEKVDELNLTLSKENLTNLIEHHLK